MADIEEIIAEANQFNDPNNITGCLTYNNGFFHADSRRGEAAGYGFD
jgi:hypothetical protein